MDEQWKESFIPEDIALAIVSYLQFSEVCSLGSCSKFWRKICGSDCVWVSLCKDRWPSLKIYEQSSIPVMIKSNESSSHEDTEQEFSSVMGWRGFYIERHYEMAARAATVVKFVEESTSSESLEVGHFLQAIDKLVVMKMELKDVAMFLLTSKQHVLVNLVGVHYCLFWLEIVLELMIEINDGILYFRTFLGGNLSTWRSVKSVNCDNQTAIGKADNLVFIDGRTKHIEPERVVQALWSHHISERQVCIKWWKLGRWFYGFRMRDESHSKKVSLGDLALFKEKEVQGILFRGAIHDVFRVQISVPDPVGTTWAWGSMHTQD